MSRKFEAVFPGRKIEEFCLEPEGVSGVRRPAGKIMLFDEREKSAWRLEFTGWKAKRWFNLYVKPSQELIELEKQFDNRGFDDYTLRITVTPDGAERRLFMNHNNHRHSVYIAYEGNEEVDITGGCEPENILVYDVEPPGQSLFKLIVWGGLRLKLTPEQLQKLGEKLNAKDPAITGADLAAAAASAGGG